MTPLAVALAEQMSVVDRLVTAAVATVVRLRGGQIEHRLRVALAARDVGVASELWHARVFAIVVIELHRALLRLPHGLGVAAVAAQQILLLELVRLIVAVTARRTAQRVRPHERLQALLVLRLVAIVAVDRGVLAVELPPGEIVVEAGLAAGLRLPAHDVERSLLVLAVTGLAALRLHRR